jgi:hypothetical protein
LHEKLETVTIRSSVLRYRLRTFPEQFKAELKEAMAAAHQLNAAQIKELKVWTVSGLSNIGIVYTYIVLIFRGFFGPVVNCYGVEVLNCTSGFFSKIHNTG